MVLSAGEDFAVWPNEFVLLFAVNKFDILQTLMRAKDVFKKSVFKHFRKVRIEGSLWVFLAFRDRVFPEADLV